MYIQENKGEHKRVKEKPENIKRQIHLEMKNTILRLKKYWMRLTADHILRKNILVNIKLQNMELLLRLSGLRI